MLFSTFGYCLGLWIENNEMSKKEVKINNTVIKKYDKC